MARNELLIGLIDRIFEVVHGHIFDKAVAKKIAEGIVDVVQEDFGGTHLYVPKESLHKLIERDDEISRKFNGKNTIELGLEYGLTEMRIRQILNKRRPNRAK